MPFKTKKRKIKAGSRSFVFSEGAVSIVDPGKMSTEVPGQKKYINVGIEDLSYLRSDLIKIISLSAFIIAAQIVLSLTLFK